MFGLRSDKTTFTFPFTFPETKLKNVSCTCCKHHFYLRDFLKLRSSSIPLLLPCGHAICENCVKMHPNEACKQCKYTLTSNENFNSGDNSLLPLNTYLFGLISAIHLRPVTVDDPKISFYHPLSARIRQTLDQGRCNECGMIAVIKCGQCNVLYCNLCYLKIHGNALQNHQKIIINDIPKDDTFLLNSCNFHTAEALDYYCDDCQARGCSHCMIRCHSGHKVMSQKEKNEDFVDDFNKVLNDIVEALGRISHSQKKLKQMMMFPSNLQDGDNMEATINRHFAYLHGVLQIMEENLIHKLHEQRKCLVKNLNQIQNELKQQEEQLQTAIVMATTAKENLSKINLKDVIDKLNVLLDVPCYLIGDTTEQMEKVKFEVDNSIVKAIQNHCQIHVPKTPQFDLLRKDHLPEDYKVEELSIENSLCNYLLTDEQRSMQRSSSVSSISSRRSDFTTSSKTLCSNSQQSDILEKGSSLLVRILHINSPSSFYVMQLSKVKELEAMEENLSKYTQMPKTKPADIMKGKMYMVFYVDKWYRGRIKRFHTEPGSDIKYEISYVDYGNVNIVNSDQIREIPSQYALIPSMAIHCALYDLTPRNGSWDVAANQSMLSIINEKDKICMFIHNIEHSIYIVDLCKTPSKDGDIPVSIRDCLLFLEHGRLTDSDKLLRTNPHSMRKMFREELVTDEYINVLCTCVESPSSIYVQKISQENQAFLQQLQTELNTEYGRNMSKNKMIHVPVVGMMCAARSGTKGSWYRAQIVSTPGDKMVEIRNVDTGIKVILRYDKLRRLLPKYMISKTQAIKLTIKDVAPLPKDSGQWSTAAKSFVNTYLFNKAVSIFIYEKKQDSYIASIFIEEHVNISQLLIQNNLVRYCGLGKFSIKEDNRIYPIKEHRMKGKKATAIKMLNKATVSSNTIESSTDPFKIKVNIVKTVSPDCIYVFDVSHIHERSLLIEQMQHFYEKFYCKPQKAWEKDAVCAVYSPKDKIFLRGKILEMISVEEALVFFYDSAVEEVISVKDIQPLHTNFASVPIYLFKIKLAGISPSGGKASWTNSAIDLLKDTIARNNEINVFSISKAAGVEDDAIPVQLWLQQSKSQGPLSPTVIETILINRMLVEEGVALPIKGFTKKQEKVLAVEFRKQLKQTYLSIYEDNIEWGSTDNHIESTNMVTFSRNGNNDNSDSDDEILTETSCHFPDMIPIPSENATWLPAMEILLDEFTAVPTYLDYDCIVYMHLVTCIDTLKYMEATLEKHFRNTVIEECDKHWRVGDICIAQYHINKKWYRAIVTKILNDDVIEVQFVDYGNVEECSIGTLRRRVILGNIPIQCTKCEIYGLKPATQTKWQTMDLDKIHFVIVDKKCIIKVLGKNQDRLVVSITLQTPTKIDLITYLIRKVKMNVLTTMSIGDEILSCSGSDFETSSPIDSTTYNTESSTDIIIEECRSICNDDYTTILMENERSSDSNSYCNNVSVSKELSLNNTMSLKNHLAASTSLSISCDSIKDKYELIDVGNESMPELFELQVTCLVNSIVFYGHLGENSHSEMLNNIYKNYVKMMKDIQESAPEQPFIKKPLLFLPCCTKFGDGVWYRCQIINIDQEGSVIVQYVDFGNEEERTVDELRYLKPEWLTIPILAIQCKLWNITSTASVEQYTEVLSKKLQEIMEERTLIAKRKNQKEGYVEVELYDDMTCSNLIYNSLIGEGLYQSLKSNDCCTD